MMNVFERKKRRERDALDIFMYFECASGQLYILRNVFFGWFVFLIIWKMASKCCYPSLRKSMAFIYNFQRLLESFIHFESCRIAIALKLIELFVIGRNRLLFYTIVISNAWEKKSKIESNCVCILDKFSVIKHICTHFEAIICKITTINQWF